MLTVTNQVAERVEWVRIVGSQSPLGEHDEGVERRTPIPAYIHDHLMMAIKAYPQPDQLPGHKAMFEFWEPEAIKTPTLLLRAGVPLGGMTDAPDSLYRVETEIVQQVRVVRVPAPRRAGTRVPRPPIP